MIVAWQERGLWSAENDFFLTKGHLRKQKKAL